MLSLYFFVTLIVCTIDAAELEIISSIVKFSFILAISSARLPVKGRPLVDNKSFKKGIVLYDMSEFNSTRPLLMSFFRVFNASILY